MSEKWVARATRPCRSATRRPEPCGAGREQARLDWRETRSPFRAASRRAAQASGLCYPKPIFQTRSEARRARASAGVTLVEFLVAIPLGILVLALVVLFSIYTSRSFAGLLNYADLEQDSRTAVDTMSQQIRQTTALTGFTTNKLTFTDYDGKTLEFTDRKSTRLNSSHIQKSRMPSSA